MAKLSCLSVRKFSHSFSGQGVGILYRASFIAGLAGILFFLPFQAMGHPHVFVYTGITIDFDDKGMAGMQVRWVFDEMFSSMTVDEFDQNHNGRFEPPESAALKQGAFSNLSKFNYFTHIKIDDKVFNVKYVKDFKPEIINNKLVYNFFIPCHVSAIQNYKTIKIAVYDETFYTSMFLIKNGVSYTNNETYDVAHSIARNREEAYYYGQIYPEEITLRFRYQGE